MSGTVRDCACPRARHEHGTRAAYVSDRCRCDACRVAVAAYERHRIRQSAYGRWQPYIDADPVRAHLAALSAAGVGLKRVTALSGISSGVLSKIVYGIPGKRPPARRVRRETADRILAVRLDALADGAHIDATGTHRRLQALVAAGWSVNRIAGRLGTSCANLHTLLKRPRVEVGTARAVRMLYDELWDAPPPASSRSERGGVTRARRYAAERGWALPMAWDDDTIDDPAATPTVGDRSAGGCIEDVLWLMDAGETPSVIARRVGLTPGGVAVALRKAGLHEQAKQFDAAQNAMRRAAS